MSVFDLKRGDKAKITGCSVTGNAYLRLASLGIAVGEIINVLAFSLFKSSVLISCGAVRLAMRKSLAQSITVELCV